MVIHQDMEAAYHLGLLTGEEMREFDEGCLIHEPAVPTHTPAGGAPLNTGGAKSRTRAAKTVSATAKAVADAAGD
jgi:hypothetical protein